MTATQTDQNILGTTERALELGEAALGEVARIAIEQIHGGLEAGNHVDAAARDMRSALRQLVLAERELGTRSGQRAGQAAHPGDFVDVVRGLGADGPDYGA
jgi:hypothetical protein